MTLPPLNAVESMRNKENYVHLKFLLSRAKKPIINNIKLELDFFLCGLLSHTILVSEIVLNFFK